MDQTPAQLQSFAKTSQEAAMAYVKAHQPSGIPGLLAGLESLFQTVLSGFIDTLGKEKAYDIFQSMTSRLENKLFAIKQ